VIDRFRYIFGVMNVIALPSGLLFWLLIHPWAHRWRGLGPGRTYLIVVPLVVASGTALYRVRDRLLGADLGIHWSLIAIALVLYAVMTRLELQVSTSPATLYASVMMFVNARPRSCRVILDVSAMRSATSVKLYRRSRSACVRGSLAFASVPSTR
jgi:hypothetical protein